MCEVDLTHAWHFATLLQWPKALGWQSVCNVHQGTDVEPSKGHKHHTHTLLLHEMTTKRFSTTAQNNKIKQKKIVKVIIHAVPECFAFL
jgi:hypothetical protein